MNTQEIVAEILQAVKPTQNLAAVENIVEGGYLTSFELMALITELGERFQVEVDVEEIIPENFNSLQAMVNMVDKLRAAQGGQA